jgi:alpha-D-ribose 1-methylphosphonate 5-phosphate C-P lyase
MAEPSDVEWRHPVVRDLRDEELAYGCMHEAYVADVATPGVITSMMNWPVSMNRRFGSESNREVCVSTSAPRAPA